MGDGITRDEYNKRLNDYTIWASNQRTVRRAKILNSLREGEISGDDARSALNSADYLYQSSMQSQRRMLDRQLEASRPSYTSLSPRVDLSDIEHDSEYQFWNHSRELARRQIRDVHNAVKHGKISEKEAKERCEYILREYREYDIDVHDLIVPDFSSDPISLYNIYKDPSPSDEIKSGGFNLFGTSPRKTVASEEEIEREIERVINEVNEQIEEGFRFITVVSPPFRLTDDQIKRIRRATGVMIRTF